VNSGLADATKSNYWNVEIAEQLGVLAASPKLFQRISNLKPYSPEVIIVMFISYSTIQFTIFLLHSMIEAL
jgi:hypothetical protein